MSETNKYREWILQTIDSLRSRKARPDLERICRMVRRRHGSDPERTRSEMEKLIHEQTVLKVSYKGSISYRNAAKVQRKNRAETELAVLIVGSGGGGGSGRGAQAEQQDKEGAREQEHLHIDNKNSGGALHTCCDQEPSTGACRDQGDPPASKPCQGGICGASTATRCDRVECGCKEQGDSGRLTEQQGAALSLGTAASEACGTKELSSSEADNHDPSSTRGARSPPLLSPPLQQQQPQHQHPLKQAATTKPKVRHSATSAAGHKRPLGLKEILGYLSSQEGLSQETLTRGKVKVVMEREVAGGRLRRSRSGSITLSPRIALTKQQQPVGEKGSKPSEKETEEKEEKKEQELEEKDHWSSSKDEGLSPVAMETKLELVSKDAEIQMVVQQTPTSSSSRAPGVAADLSTAHNLVTRSLFPLCQESSLSHCDETKPTDSKTLFCIKSCGVTSRLDRVSNTSKRFNVVELREAEGENSCLLTPNSSPTHGGVLHESPLCSEDGSGGCIKCNRLSLLDWTVSDVVSYFTAAGFEEQAAAFKAQEIDGKSLLLMKRSDVLTGLSIKLGPALKIYERHVKVLQRSHFEDDS